MKTAIRCVALAVLVAAQARGQDWGKLPVPADAGPGQEWRIQADVSDDFLYEFVPTAEAATIGGKWTNYYKSGGWEGPGTTKWRHENVEVSKGLLRIQATRVPNETKSFKTDTDKDGQPREFNLPATRLGCITSVGTVSAPAYVEARVKIANAVLASNVWMLSADTGPAHTKSFA